MSLQTIVVVIFCAVVCFGENTKICENKHNLKDVRIPLTQLLKQEDFDNFVLGANLREAYVLFPDPAPFNVSSNFNCEITAIDATTYQRVCTGLYEARIGVTLELYNGEFFYTPVRNPNCTVFNLTMTRVSQGDIVSFTYTNIYNNSLNDYYWSPCPGKFILRIQCPPESLQQNNKCSITGARITVFLVGDVNLSNAPWNDISKEMFTATGVRFGDVNGMNWYFTESTGTPCVPWKDDNE